MSNPRRLLPTCAQLAGAALLLLTPAFAHASGAVLPPAGTGEPTTLDAQVAIAVTPFGTTRWTRLTVGGTQSVMWLVPARPGAALDWASDGWLRSLEDATSPRVAPPSATPPCNMPSAAEQVSPWTAGGVKKFPKAVLVHESEGDVRAHVAARGFAVSNLVAAKIADAYARGYTLVSLELDASGASVIASPTLRVSDDGAAVVPLALTGSTESPVRVTALVIGDGPATLAGARELDPSALTWGRNYSSYANARASTLVAGGGAVWLREAAAHEILFDGLAVPRATPIEPLVSGYFHDATGKAQPTCAAAARDAGSGTGTVGRACASGALVKVPGGSGCTPEGGTIDPGSFTCGAGVDDLALALSGSAPARTFITRFTGLVPQNGFGLDTAIASTVATESPVVFAGRYEPCPVVVDPPSSSGGLTPPPPSSSPADPARPYHYERSSGCSGSATTVVYDDTGEEEPVADEGCGSSSTGTSTSTGDDSDSCSGGSSSSSSGSSSDDDSDSSGWDSDDDDSDSSDSSDSSTSDSCDCGKSTTGSSTSSSSGWDDEDSEATAQSLRIGGEGDAGASPGAEKATKKKKHGKKHLKKTSSSAKKRSGPSPVSRYALLFVALVLPLRRRLRLKKL